MRPRRGRRLIFENITPAFREDCPLAAAHGRVLCGEVCADRDLPPFDRVTMDGYAVRAAALAAGTTVFRVEGVQAAGMRAFKLGAATEACIEVMTGAVLPEGADCVVPYEETRRDGTGIAITGATAHLATGHAIHRRGTDHRAGDVIVRPGIRLTGREDRRGRRVRLQCADGQSRAKIAVVATGDELVEVETWLRATKSAGQRLRTACRVDRCGVSQCLRFHLRDVRQEIERDLAHLAEFDVVVISGGISRASSISCPASLTGSG